MKWLIDEMFPAEVAARLTDAGHDARSVAAELRGRTDQQLLEIAITDGRVLVTEDLDDFIVLLMERTDRGDAVAPVVFAKKASVPSDPGRLAATLANDLEPWATEHRDPFPTAYSGSDPETIAGTSMHSPTDETLGEIPACGRGRRSVRGWRFP